MNLIELIIVKTEKFYIHVKVNYSWESNCGGN